MSIKPVMSMFASEIDCLRARDKYYFNRIAEIEQQLEAARKDVGSLTILALRSGQHLRAWHAKYWAYNPEWLPPAGDVTVLEDIDAAIEASKAGKE